MDIRTLGSLHQLRKHPYPSPPDDSDASSTTSTIFSVDARSQTSEASTACIEEPVSVSWSNDGIISVNNSCHNTSRPVRQFAVPLQINTQDAVPQELRQNPRRCSTTVNHRPPPPLVRQSERKGQFVDSLVDSATTMVEVIWPLSVPHCRSEGTDGQSVLPLRFFIQETLRRSKTSFSTLQVALYYLILIKAHLPCYDFTMEQPLDSASMRALQCGRRMFLAALILASKYLQDRNYSAKAWSKISGLKVCEINTNEMAFLKTVNWKLHVPEELFDRWHTVLMTYTNQEAQGPWSPTSGCGSRDWRAAIQRLTPDLEDGNVPLRALATPILSRASPLRAVTSPVVFQPCFSPVTAGPPRGMEPMLSMPPPTPNLIRMGPLSTPSLTPQSAISNTPAASFVGYESRRPSLASAMAQAQCQIRNQSYVSTNEMWSNPAMAARRPSIISAASTSSSPESMVSDTSRFSRSSSISSASSITSASVCAPTPGNLARMATLRNAGLTYALPASTVPSRNKENYSIGPITMEPMTIEPESSPDFDGFHITDGSPLKSRRAKHNGETASKRKRGRSSVDLTLQQNVRNLLNASTILDLTTSPSVEIIDDSAPATSFILDPYGAGAMNVRKALQSPARSVPAHRLPVAKDMGRKRTCCTQEWASNQSATTVFYDLTGDD